MMRTDELDFALPAELIAQHPAPRRQEARLLHYQGAGAALAHRSFSDLPRLLRPGDLLVFNDAKVLPARFMLRKSTGGLIEGLYLGGAGERVWRVMLRNLGRRRDLPLAFDREPELVARVLAERGAGEYDLLVQSDDSAPTILGRLGRVPLPPYIRRRRGTDPHDAQDARRYQTVYAAAPGSVAAPTAGLHFTTELLEQLDRRGIERTFVTLHVGAGTFKPVTSDTLDQHIMHREAYELSSAAAEAVNRAQRDGRRLVAVGTTTARVLESLPPGPVRAASAQTEIFIYPPYSWKRVGALLTNFHLPRSTLIALVAALVGLETQRRLYREAIAQRYRFFSYGDAMFLE